MHIREAHVTIFSCFFLTAEVVCATKKKEIDVFNKEKLITEQSLLFA